MVKLRLMRTGRRNRPSFRLVAIEAATRRDGQSLEFLGHYQPHFHPAKIEIKEAAVYEWLKKGAQPSDTVKSLLSRMGMWAKWAQISEGKDVSAVVAKRRPEKKQKIRKKRSKVTKGAAPAPVEAAKPEAAKA